MKTIKINIELSENETCALAQFVKRIGWQEIRGNAENDDEAYLMQYAIFKIEQSLAEKGFNPR